MTERRTVDLEGDCRYTIPALGSAEPLRVTPSLSWGEIEQALGPGWVESHELALEGLAQTSTLLPARS
jgi:hypothetical protein